MRHRQPVPPELLALAAHQDRVITREQALGCGLSQHALARLLRERTWRALARGVYCTDPAEPAWLSWCWAGVLIGGDRARLGGAAAAYLHGIIEDLPREIAVLVPGTGGRPRIAGPWRFIRDQEGHRSPASRGSPPRLGVEDTILDLAENADLADVIGWSGRAIQQRRTTPHRLRTALERRSRVARRKPLAALFADVSAGVRSPLERHYLIDVERAHGLPIGERQAPQGGTQIDVWYREFGLIVELDGHRGHDGEGRFRDLRRDNRSTSRGQATLRYGYPDVLDAPCLVAHQVADLLTRRGWTDLLQRCPRCPSIMPVSFDG